MKILIIPMFCTSFLSVNSCLFKKDYYKERGSSNGNNGDDSDNKGIASKSGISGETPKKVYKKFSLSDDIDTNFIYRIPVCLGNAPGYIYPRQIGIGMGVSQEKIDITIQLKKTMYGFISLELPKKFGEMFNNPTYDEYSIKWCIQDNTDIFKIDENNKMYNFRSFKDKRILNIFGKITYENYENNDLENKKEIEKFHVKMEFI